MLDIYECNKEKLDSLDFVWNLLDRIPDMIGMHKITQPYVFAYDANGDSEKYGISGMVIIAESHISIHTFPAKLFATIDVYSCRDFEENELIRYITGQLDTLDFERKFVIRGRKYSE